MKRGRNPKRLVRALKVQQKPTRAKVVLQRERDAYEAAIRDYKGDDPLKPWLAYIAWTQESFTAGGESGRLVTLLEKCTRHFLRDEKYTGDERYLRVWVTYADQCREPLDIFQFLEANAIGRKNSLLYEAWGLVLESRQRFTEAIETFELGQHRGAQPESRLKAAKRGFEVRAARRIKRAVDEDLERSQLGLDDEENQSQRRDMRRPLQGLVLGSSSRMSTSRRRRRGLSAAAASSSTGRARQRAPLGSGSGNFTIFCDNDRKRGAREQQGAASSKASWKELATQKAVNKENTRSATTWNAAPLGGQAPAPAPARPASLRERMAQRRARRRRGGGHRARGGARKVTDTAPAPVSIFIDPECKERERIDMRRRIEGTGLRSTSGEAPRGKSLESDPLQNFSPPPGDSKE